ncbi:hypothetical protein [Thiomicrorhabdus sp.]|uniref:sensor histidine kinase n=1 Tax=Thiomicrorhabdus sp. TaxID=2039724 RepID=UPI0029C751E8|nr:hypothetical protein [Thiomicrorhabdus sp.]
MLQRLQRAGITMTDLTNTLLWMNRESEQSMPELEIRLDEELQEAVRGLNYLLEHKEIELECRTEPFAIRLAKGPCLIVLNNLIRNAFQHSWSGRILIQQEEDRIVIRNTLPAAGQSSDDQGFGLGMMLIEKLCRQFGWQYSSRSDNGEHITMIEFKPSLNPLNGESL